MATQAEAHREWHLNARVPMGQAGCPQDACDGPAAERVTVRCGHCRDWHSAATSAAVFAAVRACAAFDPCRKAGHDVVAAECCYTCDGEYLAAAAACEHGMAARLCAGPGHYPQDRD